jgi:hypothetical protein
VVIDRVFPPTRAWRALTLIVVLFAHASVGVTNQPTPRVSIEFAEEQTTEANSVVAVLTIPASIEVSNTVLSFQTAMDAAEGES